MFLCPADALPEAEDVQENENMMAQSLELEIKPRRVWRALNLRELWGYHELFALLVWRDITVRYKQTLLGGLWAVLQPLLGMLVFTFVFHRLAGIQSDGAPYSLFVYAGLLPWTFFANAVSLSGNSLVNNQELISKVYFPRMLVPLASIAAFLLDMLIGLILLLGLMVYYHWPLSFHLLWLPLFIVGSLLATCGLGLVVSAMNVYFRDVKYAVPFFIQMGLFVTPVLYPLSYLPEKFRVLMELNPLAGMVEGFRYSLLGSPARWEFTGISFATGVGLFVAGLFIFRTMESRFADVI